MSHIRIRTAPLLAVIACFMLALAGCGSAVGAQPGSQATPVACGSVSSNPRNQATDPQASQVERCFHDAFKACHAAMMTFNEGGFDWGYVHHLAVKVSGGECVVADDSTGWVGSPGNTKAVQAECAHLDAQPQGLVASGCSAGRDSFTIPAYSQG